MRTFFLTFILLIGTIISCTPKNYEKPDNLINRNDMIEVLADYTLVNKAYKCIQCKMKIKRLV